MSTSPVIIDPTDYWAVLVYRAAADYPQLYIVHHDHFLAFVTQIQAEPGLISIFHTPLSEVIRIEEPCD
jgi:hypothetical protein